MSNVIDYSKVAFIKILFRGDQEGVFKLLPKDGVIIDENVLKIVFGVNGKKIGSELTVGSGIVDNLDGSFTVTITPNNFVYTNCSEFNIYGLANEPNKLIAIGEITYYKSIK